MSFYFYFYHRLYLEEDTKFNQVLGEMSENAQIDPCTLTNPRETTPEILAKIYEYAYKGKDIDF